MIGDALLVAPIAPGIQSRKVVLPAGKWFDFYTGRLAGENETIEVTPPLSQIPVFVKDGSLVPMIGDRVYAPRSEDVLALDVRHYGDRPGTISVYDDDGETFEYERGDRSWTRLSRRAGCRRRLAGHGHAGSKRQALALFGCEVDVHVPRSLGNPSSDDTQEHPLVATSLK